MVILNGHGGNKTFRDLASDPDFTLIGLVTTVPTAGYLKSTDNMRGQESSVMLHYHLSWLIWQRQVMANYHPAALRVDNKGMDAEEPG